MPAYDVGTLDFRQYLYNMVEHIRDAGICDSVVTLDSLRLHVPITVAASLQQQEKGPDVSWLPVLADVTQLLIRFLMLDDTASLLPYTLHDNAITLGSYPYAPGHGATSRYSLELCKPSADIEQQIAYLRPTWWSADKYPKSQSESTIAVSDTSTLPLMVNE